MNVIDIASSQIWYPQNNASFILIMLKLQPIFSSVMEEILK